MTDRTVRCPRCGYSLVGELETWTTACPCRGRCSECGLDFEWYELLSPHARAPDWFVEGRRGLMHSARGTLSMTFCPWRFWGELKMSHRFRLRRIAAYGIMLLAIVWGLGAAGHAWLASRHYDGIIDNGGTVSIGRGAYVLYATAAPVSPRAVGTYTFPRWARTGFARPMTSPLRLWSAYRDSWGAGLTIAWTLVVWLLGPLTFVALPVTRRRMRVRTAHLVRITWYAAPYCIVIAAVVYASAANGAGARFLGGGRWGGPNYFALGCYVGVLWIWWGFATRRYLRMRHAWGVATAVMIVGVLGASAVCYWAAEALS